MALSQGLPQRVVGEQQAVTACLVVTVGGWQSKGLKGKGTGFLTLANTAGLFMEAEPLPEARSCAQLSSWSTSLAVTWSCPPLLRGWQIIWLNVRHLYTCDLRSYAGRILLVFPLKRSWFTCPRNWWWCLAEGQRYLTACVSCRGDNYVINSQPYEKPICALKSMLWSITNRTYFDHSKRKPKIFLLVCYDRVFFLQILIFCQSPFRNNFIFFYKIIFHEVSQHSIPIWYFVTFYISKKTFLPLNLGF